MGRPLNTRARLLLQNRRSLYCCKIAITLETPNELVNLARRAKLGALGGRTEYCLCLLSFEFVVPLAGSPTPDAAS